MKKINWVGTIILALGLGVVGCKYDLPEGSEKLGVFVSVDVKYIKEESNPDNFILSVPVTLNDSERKQVSVVTQMGENFYGSVGYQECSQYGQCVNDVMHYRIFTTNELGEQKKLLVRTDSDAPLDKKVARINFILVVNQNITAGDLVNFYLGDGQKSDLVKTELGAIDPDRIIANTLDGIVVEGGINYDL
ncbi:hypothetical protein HOK51_00630 [Candidatus Woesearchaeota archaeon]|mgnify:FL=1|jgi:hypothetical protein|nr:hypothetical protein [Candidatus Woesearchaeota archaeon]MBT6518319.1 hypothetical protein [Candidatus Woesearchaeota archaeon]MBT7366616.1 hypothetical protein [Candidatus Woesearchaeota archaeon]